MGKFVCPCLAHFGVMIRARLNTLSFACMATGRQPAPPQHHHHEPPGQCLLAGLVWRPTIAPRPAPRPVRSLQRISVCRRELDVQLEGPGSWLRRIPVVDEADSVCRTVVYLAGERSAIPTRHT